MANTNDAVTAGPTLVRIPDGCARHIHVDCHAETWDAWDALDETAGWTFERWHHDADCKPCPPGTPGSVLHQQKKRTADGQTIVVFPPHTPRPEATDA